MPPKAYGLMIVEMPLPHESEDLQNGLYENKVQTAEDYSKGYIEKPEEYSILHIPKPFKTKGCHLSYLLLGDRVEFLFFGKNGQVPVCSGK